MPWPRDVLNTKQAMRLADNVIVTEVEDANQKD
jgi:hypothetical protein